MDPAGGNGNGLAWFADPNAPITDETQYQFFSQKQIAGMSEAAIKGAIAGAKASAESAPLLNYLYWVLTLKQASA